MRATTVPCQTAWEGGHHDRTADSDGAGQGRAGPSWAAGVCVQQHALPRESQATGASGQVTFTLDPGTYRFPSEKNGTQF